MKLSSAVVLSLLAVTAIHARQPSAQGLKIVVIAGEDAINVVQQRTAVRPVIEVRDRNNLPVAGVSVTFAIQGGNVATFASGAQTFTVLTNAAGQATAAAINPISAGALQLQVQAAFQGQTALATIAQTNVMTAAQAAAASAGAAGNTAAAGGSGAAGGGGANGLILGGAGAAAAVGAVVALSGSEPEAVTPISIAVDPTGTGIREVTEFVFTVNGSDAAATWDFGDGQTASGATARHIFAREGRFNVTVKAGTAPNERSAAASIDVGTISGTWSDCPTSVPTCLRLIITQQGPTLAGQWLVLDGSGTNIRQTNPLTGTLTSPRNLTRLFESAGCLLLITEATFDAALSQITGRATHQNTTPGCDSRNAVFTIRRVN